MELNKPPENEVTDIWEPVPAIVTPGEGTLPPSDAIVLFDGTHMDQWTNMEGEPAQWDLHNGIMTVNPGSGDIKTRHAFGDIQLHIEWCTPSIVKGDGQGRGNSGIFLMDRYEIQVLDSYNNQTYVNGQAAAVYKQHIPLVNACRPPGQWQSYDIIFMAPRFNHSGQVTYPATLTLLHNGVLVHNHVSIWGATRFVGLPQYRHHNPKEPLRLQDHSDLVSFRNIWVREV